MPTQHRRALKQPALTQSILDLPAPANSATGNTWKPDKANPATLPASNDVLIREVSGPYTEIDRKLWVLLYHAAFDALHKQRLHEARPSQINALFKKLTNAKSDKGAFEIWQSIKRLTKTTLDFVERDGAENSTNLINAKIYRATDQLYYEFPRPLLNMMLANERFSRLKIHFLIGLSGKYAVSLYVALERIANQRHPVLDVNLPELHSLLQVPQGKLGRWIDLKRRALDPAIKQINEGADQGGFTVKMEETIIGRAVDRVKFIVTKTENRKTLEGNYKAVKDASIKTETHHAATSPVSHLDIDKAYEEIRKVAPGMSPAEILKQWNEFLIDSKEPLRNPMGSLIKFAEKKYHAEKYMLGLV
jgi:hypothetical protein